MENRTLKISVITAAYNSGKTIEDTLKSVSGQTYPDVEHIIKDGGSKDDTLEICERYRREFYTSSERQGTSGKSLKILSDKDKGIYDAMNQGIEAATGDVVGILNSDDFYTSEDVLQRVAEEFEADPRLEALYGDIHFVSEDASLAVPGKCVRYYSSSYFRPCLLRFGFMPAHPSFYVRREVYEKYGLYDLQFRTSSDFEWMVRIFAKYHINSKYIKKDFVTMREGGASTAGLEAKNRVDNDIVTSLKKHGIFTCGAFRYVRYAWKVSELLVSRIKNLCLK